MRYETRQFEVPVLSPEEYEDMVENNPDQLKRIMDLQRKRNQYTSMLDTFKRLAGDLEINRHGL